MTMTETTYSSTEVLDLLEGKITYRVLDYWCRRASIQIGNDGNGSGTRRRFTANEVIALDELVTRYKALQEELEDIRNGNAFARLIR